MDRSLPPNVARILESADRKRRVLIVKRDDGTFILDVQKWYRNVYEGRPIAEGWASLPTHKSIYESIEIAEREARAQFRWLS